MVGAIVRGHPGARGGTSICRRAAAPTCLIWKPPPRNAEMLKFTLATAAAAAPMPDVQGASTNQSLIRVPNALVPDVAPPHKLVPGPGGVSSSAILAAHPATPSFGSMCCECASADGAGDAHYCCPCIPEACSCDAFDDDAATRQSCNSQIAARVPKCFAVESTRRCFCPAWAASATDRFARLTPGVALGHDWDAQYDGQTWPVRRDVSTERDCALACLQQRGCDAFVLSSPSLAGRATEAANGEADHAGYTAPVVGATCALLRALDFHKLWCAPLSPAGRPGSIGPFRCNYAGSWHRHPHPPAYDQVLLD